MIALAAEGRTDAAEKLEVLRRWKGGPIAALGLVLAAYALGFVVDDYWFNAILIPFLIMALAGLGLNLLTGYAGQASLGTGAFMSVGAFATYNVLLRAPDLPLPVSFVIGGLFAGLAGVVFGLPSLRIKGFYLTASTLAAQFFLPWLFNQYGWFSNYTTSGSISAPKLEFLGSDLSTPLGRYLLTLTSVVILTWLAWNLVTSQVGRNWMAIRDMDTAAAVAGIPIAFNKLASFAISSFVIGIAGALWAFAYLGTVDARSFDLDRSFTVLFIIIIGGMGSIWGAFIGSAFVILVPILISNLSATFLSGAIDAGQSENLQKILFGALIVYFLIKEPNGLAALIIKFRRRLSLWPFKS
ncbi:branched-chain amino acid ABC transporter permease [Taklimakanibacter deserti]|uniref:branched-chain amino acid ABC transporter permease n=1 Tax=Taklimakanibacter deserti TaxID=2267839 RepID=UPI000E649216